MEQHAEKFDKLVRNTAFSLVFGSPRTAGPETAVKHARLAAEEGGLGLKSLAANADVTDKIAARREAREGACNAPRVYCPVLVVCMIKASAV